MAQYTIRNVPDLLDATLRAQARRNGVSLNAQIVESLRRGLGVAETDVVHTDMDDLAGTWHEDPVFDEALADQDTVDEYLWQ